MSEPHEWDEADMARPGGAGCARVAPCCPRAGPAARAAPWRSASTATTRRTSCATAAIPSPACPGANTGRAGASRASAARWTGTGRGPASSSPPSPPCCIPTSSARWWPRATRSGCTAGSTNSTPRSTAPVERDLMLRAADALERITGTPPRRHAHAVLGLQRRDTLSIAREMGLLYDSSLFSDDDPFEILAAGGADRDRGAAGRVDPRRRGLLHDEPFRRAASLHAARGGARHLPARVPRRARRRRDVPADDAPACHRLPLADLHPRGAAGGDRRRRRRLDRDPCRDRAPLRRRRPD